MNALPSFLSARKGLRGYWRGSFAIALALLLGACSTQLPVKDKGDLPLSLQPASSDVNSLRRIALYQERLDRITAPLLIANPDLCKKQARNLLGLTARNKYSYSPLSDAAVRVFDVDERLQVSNVMVGSGAARAGIQKGDILVSIEGRPIPEGANAENDAAALLAPIVALKSSVKLTVLRNDNEQTITVPLTRACGFWVEIGNSDTVNSYSDGRRIVITRGMADFAKTDDELALVVAKEMAHSVLGHARMLKTTDLAGDIIDDLMQVQTGGKKTTSTKVSMKPMPQLYDIMADALSLQMAARSGYDIDQALPFWQRLAAKYPATIPGSYSALHPANAARLKALPKTVARVKTIEQKRLTDK